MAGGIWRGSGEGRWDLLWGAQGDRDKNPGSGSRRASVSIPTPPFTCCGTLGKFLGFSEPRLPRLRRGPPEIRLRGVRTRAWRVPGARWEPGQRCVLPLPLGVGPETSLGGPERVSCSSTLLSDSPPTSSGAELLDTQPSPDSQPGRIRQPAMPTTSSFPLSCCPLQDSPVNDMLGIPCPPTHRAHTRAAHIQDTHTHTHTFRAARP